MNERRRSGLDELFGVLREVSKNLDRQVNAYLIGGLAMMHYGLKVTTKDVDVVLKDESDEGVFVRALGSCGFKSVDNVSEEYKAIGATTIVERSDGMRFDIFVGRVCRKLKLTEGMEQRAKTLGLPGDLQLMATAPMDIFLFKSVTDRPDDLADMALLTGLGLEWDSMVDELRGDVDNYRYLPHLAAKLEELEEVHGILIPGHRELEGEVDHTGDEHPGGTVPTGSLFHPRRKPSPW